MNWEVYEIADGGLDYPRESLLPKVGEPELEARYPPVVHLPYRPLLVEMGARRLLLDTGAGPLGPKTGQLQANLK